MGEKPRVLGEKPRSLASYKIICTTRKVFFVIFPVVLYISYMEQMELFITPRKEVAQHNNLIFAPFALGSIESKIFISMLERVDRNGEELPEWRIPLTEILIRRDGDAYEQLKKAAYTLKSQVVDIAPADPTKPYRKKFKLRSIVDKCDHEHGSGYLICQFHQDVKEYLLKLVGHYTKADLAVLKTFKDERSVRFYWMLKARFYNTDTVQITVEECRQTLLPKDSKSYQNPSDIKKHILDKVILPELENTDCAFEYGSPIKYGNKTLAWTFIKNAGKAVILQPSPIMLSDKLIQRLEDIPIDEKGIRRISEIVGQEINGVLLDEGYIHFIIKRILDDSNKYTSPGGAIINFITKGRLAKDYQKKKAKEQLKNLSHNSPPYELKLSQAQLLEAYQHNYQRNKTTIKDFTTWVKTIYPESEFSRVLIEGEWYVVKRV